MLIDNMFIETALACLKFLGISSENANRVNLQHLKNKQYLVLAVKLKNVVKQEMKRMNVIHTVSEPRKLLPLHTDLSDKETPITIAAPFWGLPAWDKEGAQRLRFNRYLIIDLHIIDFLRKGKNKDNINNLLWWAHKTNTFVLPHVALSEQHLNHGDPEWAFHSYINTLKKDYYFEMQKEEADRLYKVFENVSPRIRLNTEIMRDFLVIIKHFYNSKKSLKNKIIELCEIIHKENLPVFVFAIKVGCLFFYIKENPNQFTNAVTKKIYKDMSICEKPENEEEKLWNFASDLMLIMSAVEFFYNKETKEYNLSYIASADTTIATILRHICYGEIIVNNGHCFGKPGIRPDSCAQETLDDIFDKHLKQSPQHSFSKKDPNIDPRWKNLKSFANKISTQKYPS